MVWKIELKARERGKAVWESQDRLSESVAER